MFFTSIAIALVFLVVGVLATTGTSKFGIMVNGVIAMNLGWFYILTANFFLVFVIGLMISRYGRVRLGPDGSRPEFGKISWFAMLFNAGMGFGLVFFSVSEPAYHALNAPGARGAGRQQASLEGVKDALLHWGLHAWAIYIVVGLAIGYFCFRKGLPLRPSSALYPLLGNRIYRWPGNLVDILAVFAAIFHLATSLGLGTMAINGGLAGAFGLPNNMAVQLLIIMVLTVGATLSVMLGVRKGIRRLSLITLWLAVPLLVLVLVAGPTRFMLGGLLNYTGHYLENLVGSSLTVFDAKTQPAAAAWQATWTLFMWTGWISWAPFVGMFIARISYGRTFRQCIVGGVLAPSGVLVAWFTVFGGSGLYYELFGNANIAKAAPTKPALIVLMDQLPIGAIALAVFSLLAFVVGALFLTSSWAPGSLMTATITNGGNPRPLRASRLFWTVSVGLMGMVLLIGGGEAAFSGLQSIVTITALPFAVVLVLMCACLYKAVRQEERQRFTQQPRVTQSMEAAESDLVPEPTGRRL